MQTGPHHDVEATLANAMANPRQQPAAPVPFAYDVAFFLDRWKGGAQCAVLCDVPPQVRLLTHQESLSWQKHKS